MVVVIDGKVEFYVFDGLFYGGDVVFGGVFDGGDVEFVVIGEDVEYDGGVFDGVCYWVGVVY